MDFKVINQQLFSALNVSVDIVGDNVAVAYTRNGNRCYHESWGEHGPNDFNEFGFQIIH